MFEKKYDPGCGSQNVYNAQCYVVMTGEVKMMRGGDFFSVHPKGKPSQSKGEAFRRLVAVNYF